MNNLSSIGRIAFAIPMIIFGLSHFFMIEKFVERLPVSNAYLLIYLTGAVLVGTGAALITNKKVKPAALLLALFLSMAALVVHFPPMMDGNFNSFSDLLKDFGLAGAALYLSATSDD